MTKSWVAGWSDQWTSHWPQNVCHKNTCAPQMGGVLAVNKLLTVIRIHFSTKSTFLDHLVKKSWRTWQDSSPQHTWPIFSKIWVLLILSILGYRHLCKNLPNRLGHEKDFIITSKGLFSVALDSKSQYNTHMCLLTKTWLTAEKCGTRHIARDSKNVEVKMFLFNTGWGHCTVYYTVPAEQSYPMQLSCS